MNARQRLAQRCGEGDDVLFFEQHTDRRYRARPALPHEFGHDRPATAIVRRRPDNTTERAPIEAGRPIPDVEDLIAYMWAILDIRMRDGSREPFVVPISDSMIADYLGGVRHG